MIVELYNLNAFTKNGLGGNPAGVLAHADHLTDNQMQAIAEKAGYPETVFIFHTDKADWKFRYFTPSCEVDLCGHATLATFSLMQNLGLITAGNYRLETKAGVLNIEVLADGSVFMEQLLPHFAGIIDRAEIAASLNIRSDLIAAELPVQVVSTGLSDIIIPIRSLSELRSIQPDFDMVADISKKYHAVGYHLFSLETLYGATAHCRNFAPLYNIPEEAATGTSNAALGCYLWKHGKINAQQAGQLIFEQGYTLGQVSEICVSLKISKSDIVKVQVGGTISEFRQQQIEV